METKEQTLDELVVHARMALKRCEQGRTEWIEGMLELAATLGAARARFESNNAFGKWVADSGLKLDPNAQSNLITMSGDLVTSRRALEGVASNSIRYASEEVVKQLRSSYVARTTNSGEPTQQVVNIPLKIQSEMVSSPPEEAKIIAPSFPQAERPTYRSSERMDEILSLFENDRTKSTLRIAFAKSSGKELAAILARSLDEGFLKRNNANINTPSLRLVFPDCTPQMGATKEAKYAKTFDLLKPSDRKRFEEDVWPAAVADKATVMADQTKIEPIVRNFIRQRQMAELKRARTAKVEVATRAMPTSQRQVMMFGEHLWPRVDDRRGVYNYAELKTGIATFRDLWRWPTTDDSPKSRTIRIRQSTRWYTEHGDMVGLDPEHSLRTVWRIIHMLCRLAEENPEAECKWPMD